LILNAGRRRRAERPPIGRPRAVGRAQARRVMDDTHAVDTQALQLRTKSPARPGGDSRPARDRAIRWLVPSERCQTEPFRAEAQRRLGQAWTPGSAVFQYQNDQRATTLWYHDHTLGMTRANVYAGPVGFYLLRGGPDDAVDGSLPGPAPARGDPPGIDYFEIPIVIQDRSFTEEGELFYPRTRAFFEGLKPSQLRIPFMPGGLRRPERCRADPQPGVLRQHDGRQRAHLALARRAAAAVPLPAPERLQLARSDAAPVESHAVLADRKRGRVPAGADRGEAAPARPGRAGGRDHGLLGRPRRDRDHPQERGPGRAVPGRSAGDRLRPRQPGHDRAGDALPRRPPRGAGPLDAAERAGAAGDRAAGRRMPPAS